MDWWPHFALFWVNPETLELWHSWVRTFHFLFELPLLMCGRAGVRSSVTGWQLLPLIAEAPWATKYIYLPKDIDFPPVTSMRAWKDSSHQRSVHSCPRHKRQGPIGPVACQSGQMQLEAAGFLANFPRAFNSPWPQKSKPQPLMAHRWSPRRASCWSWWNLWRVLSRMSFPLSTVQLR